MPTCALPLQRVVGNSAYQGGKSRQRPHAARRDKVLLAKFVDKTYFFFPGGGVEFAEGVEAALKRELHEELGANLLSTTFIGASEHLFDNAGTPYHELNVVFSARIEDHHVVSKEANLTFTWMLINDLERENVLPKELVAAVVQWTKDGKTFWITAL